MVDVSAQVWTSGKNNPFLLYERRHHDLLLHPFKVLAYDSIRCRPSQCQLSPADRSPHSLLGALVSCSSLERLPNPVPLWTVNVD